MPDEITMNFKFLSESTDEVKKLAMTSAIEAYDSLGVNLAKVLEVNAKYLDSKCVVAWFDECGVINIMEVA